MPNDTMPDGEIPERMQPDRYREQADETARHINEMAEQSRRDQAARTRELYPDSAPPVDDDEE
jgi:hypothetical protein